MELLLSAPPWTEKNCLFRKMKVLFLDFDGVLNSDKCITAQSGSGVVIDPAKMPLLKEIIDVTEAKIVLSTSWREHWDKNPDLCDSIGKDINRIFARSNLQIFDKTPSLSVRREKEIEAWLTENKPKSFVVLDDMLLQSDLLLGHFVKVSSHFGGLDASDVKSAIEILNS